MYYRQIIWKGIGSKIPKAGRGLPSSFWFIVSNSALFCGLVHISEHPSPANAARRLQKRFSRRTAGRRAIFQGAARALAGLRRSCRSAGRTVSRNNILKKVYIFCPGAHILVEIKLHRAVRSSRPFKKPKRRSDKKKRKQAERRCRF